MRLNTRSTTGFSTSSDACGPHTASGDSGPPLAALLAGQVPYALLTLGVLALVWLC